MAEPKTLEVIPNLPKVPNAAANVLAKAKEGKTLKYGKSEKRNDSSSSASKLESISSESGSQVSSERPLIAKDFFWDDWLSYIASAILALALIDLSVEFLAGSTLGVLCFINDTSRAYDRDQTAYINSWCSRLLPFTEYYPLFTLVQGVLLLVPQYIWVSVFSSYFDFFFALAGTLERLRDRKTGEYNPKNSAIIHRLEEEFANRRSILVCYLLKLLAQGLLFVAFIAITHGFFTDFGSDVTCPPKEDDPHVIFGRVMCVYSRFRFLLVLQLGNIILIAVGLLIVILGVLAVFGLTHVEALGYKKVAEFAYQSALHPSHFVPKKRGYCSGFHLMSDLDFLLFKLFATDAGYGKIFKDIQVSDYAAKLLEADLQNLQIYATIRVKGRERTDDQQTSFDSHLDRQEDPRGTNMGPYMDLFIGQISKYVADLCATTSGEDKLRRAAIDIAFSPHAFTFTISRHFEKVALLHLDEYYRNSSSVVKYAQYGSNLYTIHAPTNILALPLSESMELTDTIRNKFLDWDQKKQSTNFKIQFIIVSGIDDHTKQATVSQLIEMLSFAHHVEEGAILMILKPLEVEGQRVKGFRQLKMQSRYFWDHKAQEEMKDMIGGQFPHMCKPTGGAGLSVRCGDTNCCFTFSTFKYVKEGMRQDQSDCVGVSGRWAIRNPFTLCCTSPNNDTTDSVFQFNTN